MMRIITGTARGTRLETPSGEITRPTTEMTKEGIFSSIQFDLEGRRVLDLFAGSGQMGLEAISRGAAYAVFVDASRDAAIVIRNNAQKTGLSKQTKIVNMDATEYLKSQKNNTEKFDYIFIDPPYKEQIIPEMIKKIMKADILNDYGVIFCECDTPEIDLESISDSPFGRVKLLKKYKYGKTFVFTVGKDVDEV